MVGFDGGWLVVLVGDILGANTYMVVAHRDDIGE